MSECPTVKAVCDRVADILHAERVAQNLSLSRLAAEAGLSYQAVSYIERNKRYPSLDTLLRLTRALKLDPAEVIRRAHTGE